MIASSVATNNNFTTMIPYSNTFLCQNNNPYLNSDYNDVPELSAEKSSVSSRSTEEVDIPRSCTSFNTTNLKEELNPFEQSFETSQTKPFPSTQSQQQLMKDSWKNVNSVLSNSATNVTKPVTFVKEAGSYYYHDKYPQKSTTVKRNRKRTSDLEDEEKRKNFLERNRIAALKCRQRKKQWLQNLQTRVEYLAADNEQYHIQANALREELVNLKMILLAHKECSINQEAIRNALNQTIPTVPVPTQMMSHIPSQPN